mmetsp:Transcript_46079/g.81086  ORF Transcript_46079/g.81086 Transcript_46079/m.81086 type:complete len:828 (+) Transcript_46079:87-2570(+)
MARRLLRPCLLLLGMATQVFTEPKMPGDPKYCVDLESLGMSEGTLIPEFKRSKTGEGGVQSTSDYQLVINDEKAATLLITPQLQLSKYNLLHKPTLRFNGQDQEYSPLETIQLKVVLNETIGEYRQTQTLEVLDPKPAGLFQTQRGHKYNINVVQKPDIEQIVRPLDIKVYDQDWEEIPDDPPFNPESVGKRVHFLIPDKATSMHVKLFCHSEATSLSYGGFQQDLGTTFDIDLKEPTASVLVQCQYKNERWTDNSIYDRTYVVTLTRNPGNAMLRKTKVDLLVWPPEDGSCTEEDKDSDLPYFECGTTSMKELGIIATYNNTKAVLEMVDKVDGEKYRMYNGLPTKISLGKKYQLELKAGNRTPYFFPVKFEGVAMCNTYACPDKFELLPNAQNRPCRKSVCTKKNDMDYCCQRHRASCETLECPNKGKKRACASELQCAWDPCTEKDIKKCCEDEEHPLRYCPDEFRYEYKHKNKFSKFMCDSFQCPEGFIEKLGAKTIFCKEQPCDAEADLETCCDEQAYCDLMKCPKGYTPKFNAWIFMCKSRQCDPAIDRDTCCIEVAYCDTMACPDGWTAKPHQALIDCAGNPCQFGDTSTCCSMNGMCDTYSCPAGTHQKPEAYRTQCAGFSRGVCNSPMDRLFCCDDSQTCEGFRCSMGWAIKAKPEKYFCHGVQCDPTDDAFCCDVVNPFVVGKLSLVPKAGDGKCYDGEGIYDFECETSQDVLHATVAIDFDRPVQEGLFIGGDLLGKVPVQGKTALLALPDIDASKSGKVHGVLYSHTDRHPDVRYEIRILVKPTVKPTAKPTAKPTEKRQRRRLGTSLWERLFWQ